MVEKVTDQTTEKLEFKRGDIVLCADKDGTFTSKPRPVVVVQNTDYIEGIESLTVCPLTTVLSVASVRLRLKPNAETGLKELSDIEIDKVTTIRKNRVSAKIGTVSEKDQAKINYALRVWLDL